MVRVAVGAAGAKTGANPPGMVAARTAMTRRQAAAIAAMRRGEKLRLARERSNPRGGGVEGIGRGSSDRGAEVGDSSTGGGIRALGGPTATSSSGTGLGRGFRSGCGGLAGRRGCRHVGGSGLPRLGRKGSGRQIGIFFWRLIPDDALLLHARLNPAFHILNQRLQQALKFGGVLLHRQAGAQVQALQGVDLDGDFAFFQQDGKDRTWLSMAYCSSLRQKLFSRVEWVLSR